MTLASLAARRALASPARAALTVLGVAVATASFGFLETAVSAYYAGVSASARDRLVTRNAASLAVPLPIAWRERIARVPGVTHVAAADWFGGVYRDEKNYFINLAVDAEPFLALFPEYLLDDDQRRAFLADPAGCVVGDKLARKYGWRPGDRVTLRGTLFPGDWTFTIRGIYRPRDRSTIATQMFFHIRYVDENSAPELRGHALVYFVGVADAARSAETVEAIDATFRGDAVETLTESEKSFQLTFISMAGTVLGVLRAVSGVVLAILALILGSAIATSVRERTAEVAVMRALGFRGDVLALMVAVESAAMGLAGGGLGVAMAALLIRAFALFVDRNLGAFFPIFALDLSTVAAMLGAALGIAIAAALPPALRVARFPVAAALRRVG
jgi:putative ABC transport system permease protein